MGRGGVSYGRSDTNSGWQDAVSRRLVRQATAVGAAVFVVGCTHWSDAPDRGRGIRFRLLLDAMALRAGSVGTARGLGRGAAARLLPDVRDSGGSDGVGAGFVNGIAAH